MPLRVHFGRLLSKSARCFSLGQKCYFYPISTPGRHYDAKRIYGTTKLANILMAKELARRLKSHNVVCNAVHHGSVQTDLFRNIPFLGLIQAGPIMGTLFKSAKVSTICFI